ncbi:hypothetical protein WJX72_009651 [[Myrmecia] bisecta]|uniref:LAGLIDADG endonuclease n=1 Tax=[Myrmecia] bisecta TaxID=41462 RepID=A0AAW1QFZ7_9CHLO
MKANYSSDPECSTKGFERFTANNPAVPFVEHEKLKLIGKRVVNCTHRLSRTLTDTGTEAVQALDWGQLLAVMSEVGADWTTAPWDADLSSMLHVEEPAVGGPANTSARSRHVTFRQPTEADEGNVRVPGFAKLQVRKNRAHGGWYIAGAIELGVGLLAASEFRDKLRQAEKEVFAIWAVNALEGIYEDTFIVLSNGFDMVRVTFHFYNNQYHPYKPCMAVHKVPGVLGASKSYQLFANDHKLANDAAPALALLVDSLWPAHGQSTVAQLQDKLDALDSMLANAVARGGLPAVCKEKRKADEAVDIGYKQARAE